MVEDYSRNITIKKSNICSTEDRYKCEFQESQSWVGFRMSCDFDTLSHFEILQFNEFSDHAPLSFNFYLKPRNKEHEHLNTQTDPEISRKMVWDNAKIDDFKMLLNNSMDGIHRLTTDINNEPVDDVVKNFTQFLHDKAFDIFGKTYTNRNSSSYHKK